MKVRGCLLVSLATLCLCLLPGGCSMRSIAVKNLADAVTSGAGVYASDDDPELIRQAMPFALKMNESLLAETPNHRGLLLSLCSGFTQYAYAFVEQDADQIESENLTAATNLRKRACRLYTRARDYGLRAIDVAHPGFSVELRLHPASAVQITNAKDTAALYWLAASWGSLIAQSKDKPERIADQPIVEALIDRAQQLDESFNGGAIHSFLISYEMARKGAPGDAAVRSADHYRRALELSKGQDASPMVAYAEVVCVARQKRSEFEATLKQAIAIDPDANPSIRLLNLVMQDRARWLLSRADELFAE